MAYIKTNTPNNLNAIVVESGTSGYYRTMNYYPSPGTVPFGYSQSTVKMVTNTYPAWDMSRMGPVTTLFQLKDGYSIILKQNGTNPDIGTSVSGRLYISDGTNETQIGAIQYAAVFVIMGIVYDPFLPNNVCASLAFAYDYTVHSSFPQDFGSRLLRIDELVNSSLNNSYSSSVFIAENTTANQRTYFSTVDIVFNPSYYTADDVNSNPESTDPFTPGGNTEPGGGTGDFDGTGDDISIPSLPTLSAVDAGFITLFNPTLAEMNALSSYMWAGLFDVATFKKIFADPMDAILGLSIVPVAVPNGSQKPVVVGNISTGVNMTVAASQYVEVDCGTLNVNEYWGAYLDYDPYTKAEIYLPYIGTHAIAVDDIMGKPVHVVYHVDILSGACCAYVKCGGSVLYTFNGACASSIPITGDNWTNVINGIISIAGSIGSMAATGGASAPMAIGQIASTAVNNFKPSIERSGAMGGTGGMLAVQTPYLILTRPRQALPENQNIFTGYPSFITSNLSDLSGYTEIDSIHLENVHATDAELDEIETLLKSGVIF